MFSQEKVRRFGFVWVVDRKKAFLLWYNKLFMHAISANKKLMKENVLLGL